MCFATLSIRRATQLIRAHVRENAWQPAVELLLGLCANRTAPSVALATNVVSACGRASKWQETICVLRAVQRSSARLDILSYNTAITVFSKKSRWAEALSLLEETWVRRVRPTIVTGNATISAVAGASSWVKGNWCIAIGLLEWLLDRSIFPNVSTYSICVDACSRAQRWRDAFELMRQMRVQAVEPNNAFYGTCIQTCGRIDAWISAVQMLHDMSTCRLHPDVITRSAVVSALAKSGSWEAAQAIFCDMVISALDPNAFTFAALANAYEISSSWTQALDLLRISDGFFVAAETKAVLNAIVGACAQGNRWTQALFLLQGMPKPTPIAAQALLDACETSASLKVTAAARKIAEQCVMERFIEGAVSPGSASNPISACFALDVGAGARQSTMRMVAIQRVLCPVMASLTVSGSGNPQWNAENLVEGLGNEFARIAISLMQPCVFYTNPSTKRCRFIHVHRRKMQNANSCFRDQARASQEPELGMHTAKQSNSRAGSNMSLRHNMAWNDKTSYHSTSPFDSR